MIILRNKSFASKILNTNVSGFIRGRKYDTDLDRLGRMETSQRELHGKIGDLGKESRKLGTMLNGGLAKELKLNED